MGNGNRDPTARKTRRIHSTVYGASKRAGEVAVSSVSQIRRRDRRAHELGLWARVEIFVAAILESGCIASDGLVRFREALRVKVVDDQFRARRHTAADLDRIADPIDSPESRNAERDASGAEGEGEAAKAPVGGLLHLCNAGCDDLVRLRAGDSGSVRVFRGSSRSIAVKTVDDLQNRRSRSVRATLYSTVVWPRHTG